MIEFRNVSFGYAPAVPVLQDISFSIPAGTLVLFLGANGAGKSTTFRLMNGIFRPWSGSIAIQGKDSITRSTWDIARDVCITFQHPSDQIVASTVRDEIAFGPRHLHRSNWRDLTEQSLELFGLKRFSDQHPYDLSPAGRKLLTLASAAASDARCLAFDEPSAGLSQPERHVLAGALQRLKHEGRSVMVVSHDVEQFLPLADAVMLLAGGSIVYQGTVDALRQNPGVLRSAGIEFTQGLRWRGLAERWMEKF